MSTPVPVGTTGVDTMLTTYDNPYDPFTEYEAWFVYDAEHGYNTPGYIARIAVLSDAMSDEEVSEEIERAQDEIIRYDPFGIYRKVAKEI